MAREGQESRSSRPIDEDEDIASLDTLPIELSQMSIDTLPIELSEKSIDPLEPRFTTIDLLDTNVEEPISEPLNQIYNLRDILGDRDLKLALEDWESREQALRKRVDRKKKVVRNTRNEVTMLTGFFLALQGLLLTAAAVSSSSQCKNLGLLLAVSAFVTFCALAFVWHKEVTIRRWQSGIVQDKGLQKTLKARVQQLRQEGRYFDFRRANAYEIKRTKFALSFFGCSFTATTWVAFAIGIFGALCLVAIDRLLCHSS